MANCNKCGRLVSERDDAVLLDAICGELNIADERVRKELGLNYGSRHIRPVMDGATMVCEGSPSRAQYLPNMPRDSRPGAKFDENYGKLAMEAAALLESLFPNNM